MDATGQGAIIKGIPTTEPTFGLPAYWVSPEDKDRAEIAGYTVVDCSTVIVTHLTEFIKRNSYELMGRQELKELVDVIKEKNPAVIEELIPNLLSLGEIQKVVQNLLKEQVPVRDLLTILEALADAAHYSKEIDYLTEQVRQAMARTICRKYENNEGKIIVLTLHPQLEQDLIDSIQETRLGAYPVLEPQLTRKLLERLKSMMEKFNLRGASPVVLCSPRCRMPFRRLVEKYLPHLAVLSLSEIYPGYDIEAVGTVTVD